MLCKIQKPYGSRVTSALNFSESAPEEQHPIPDVPSFGEDLCQYTWDVIVAYLNDATYPSFPSRCDKNLETSIFVTWNKSAGNEENLRGCIGCLEKIKLCPGLQDYAIKSAFRDSRFSSIRKTELGSLTCYISILYSFESSSHVFDWEIGKHGIIINYDAPNGVHYTATYLPEVPLEHGMTYESAIEDLCKKAGYPLDRSLWESRIKVTRYQSRRVRMTAGEYLQRRPGAF